MKQLGRFYIIILSLFLLSCSDDTKEKKYSAPEKVAIAAYNNLINGEFDEYLSKIQSNDSISKEYRAELLASTKQFVENENQKKGGIKSVSVSKIKTNKKDTFSQIMLILKFGNGTSEEVVVPVIKENDAWRLK